MYQCINSSKCISKHRIYDETTDCDYNDDENPALLESVYPIEEFNKFFLCTTTKKYIRRKLVGDGKCDCDPNKYLLCDDEEPELHYIKKHISFSTICDGFTELIPIDINEQNKTDETECEYWPCNNTYTRCDGFWNCLDGADEIDCDPTPLLYCPPRSHVCISVETKQLMCLPLEKANNGEIDCLGGIDEPKLCRSKSHIQSRGNFHCRNESIIRCASFNDVCNFGNICLYGIDRQSCNDVWNLSLSYDNICLKQFPPYRSDIEEYFCNLLADVVKPRIVHFSLDKRENLRKRNITNTVISRSAIIKTSSNINTNVIVDFLYGYG
jgi:hypothetical protein